MKNVNLFPKIGNKIKYILFFKIYNKYTLALFYVSVFTFFSCLQSQAQTRFKNNGRFFISACSASPRNANLYEIDYSSGSPVLTLRANYDGRYINGLSFYDGYLWCVGNDNDSLFRIDASYTFTFQGRLSVAYPTACGGSGQWSGATVDPYTKRMYISRWKNVATYAGDPCKPDSLFIFDLNTAAPFALIKKLPITFPWNGDGQASNIADLAFGADSKLYAIVPGTTTSPNTGLCKIDTATGAVTIVNSSYVVGATNAFGSLMASPGGFLAFGNATTAVQNTLYHFPFAAAPSASPTGNFTSLYTAGFSISTSDGASIIADQDNDGKPDTRIDIDDDNDGITDFVEACGAGATSFGCLTADPSEDSDGDGLVNYRDANYAAANGSSLNSNGVIAKLDFDGDGIIDQYDLDSDNDGIQDIVEAGGVDTDGDGRIDGSQTADSDGDGLLNTYDPTTGGTAIANLDTDGDGSLNFKDLDSDNDGIPDILEAGGTDANNDGKIDGTFVDDDGDGWSDGIDGKISEAAINNTNVLIITGTDTDADGRPNSYPRANIDKMGLPNPYDLDSDNDGISDYEESGLRAAIGRPTNNSNRTIAFANAGYTSGWSNNIIALSSITLTNTDGVGKPNYLDIDSDNDGITDNIEGQSTAGYIVGSDTDTDGDGLMDVYDSQTSTYGGNALTPYDHDVDGIPDYMDTDTDNDGVPDRNEGDRNNRNLTQATIDASGDTDGDGLMDYFDSFNLNTATTSNFYKNVSMSNMAALGGFNGPTPSGSSVQLQMSSSLQINRDWRDITVLPLHIISFTGILNGTNAILNWQASNDVDVDKYIIERSIDGTNFYSISQVLSLNKVSSNYTYKDDIQNLHAEKIFYRIKQVGKSNETFYTNILTFKIGSVIIKELKLYPNPAKTYVILAFNSDKNAHAEISVFNSTGQKLTTLKQALQKGINTITIYDVVQYANGIYFVQVLTNEDIYTGKFSK
jgi:Secretion system C-terminal sorting domain